MEVIYLIIISMLMASTIYFALKAHKYKVICSVLLLYFKKQCGFEISIDDIKKMARQELRDRFNK